jgi:hypothetical protein
MIVNRVEAILQWSYDRPVVGVHEGRFTDYGVVRYQFGRGAIL